MSILTDITDLVTIAPAYTGYAPTDAVLPYVAHRPLLVDSLETAINGDALDWDYQTTLYCCGGSVEASFNLALSVAGTLQGARIGNTTLSTSIGYVGAPVEGHYESQVTVQLNQGGI
jgi:hypothetical protein